MDSWREIQCHRASLGHSFNKAGWGRIFQVFPTFYSCNSAFLTLSGFP